VGKDDNIVIKNLHTRKSKGYKAKKMMKEFSAKQCNKTTLNYFFNI